VIVRVARLGDPTPAEASPFYFLDIEPLLHEREGARKEVLAALAASRAKGLLRFRSVVICPRDQREVVARALSEWELPGRSLDIVLFKAAADELPADAQVAGDVVQRLAAKPDALIARFVGKGIEGVEMIAHRTAQSAERGGSRTAIGARAQKDGEIRVAVRFPSSPNDDPRNTSAGGRPEAGRYVVLKRLDKGIETTALVVGAVSP
jgi:hypothetical protein